MFLMQTIEQKESSFQICIHINFWVESENRFVNLKVSAKGMRIIDKKGISKVLKEIRARGEKV